eukprot:gene15519-biopygen707
MHLDGRSRSVRPWTEDGAAPSLDGAFCPWTERYVHWNCFRRAFLGGACLRRSSTWTDGAPLWTELTWTDGVFLGRSATWTDGAPPWTEMTWTEINLDGRSSSLDGDDLDGDQLGRTELLLGRS